MNRINLLKIAYGANIFILVPVVYGMLAGRGVIDTFEGKVPESEGLRIMVASLWSAILLASIAGFWHPRFFAAVLPIQIVYKAMWLMLFILPFAMRSGWGSIPIGSSTVFLLIVIVYPFIFWFALRD